MKRPSSSSDPLSEDKVVLGGFQTMVEGGLGLGEEEEVEMMMESGGVASLSVGEKKRRLSVEQVKALEKNFEVENKLEPERKQKLAQELGLQPRQVAVWFQNRRARWKTKQLERDYGVLKANYDALKLSFDALNHDNRALLAEVQQLKGKLSGEGESSHCSVKEEPVEDKNLAEREQEEEEEEEEENPLIYKDGSSDSDSSAILNSPYHLRNMVLSQNNNQVQEEEQLKEPKEEQNQQLFMGFNHTSSSSPSSRLGFHCYFQQPPQQQMVMKMEENGFLTEEEPCSTSFFSDEQPPSLAWYCSDQWD